VTRKRLLVVAVTAALAGAAPASADVRISAVDTSSYPTIRATIVSSSGPELAPILTENGRAVVGMAEENLGRAKAVVLAVDDSRSMAGKPLADAAVAARGFVSAKPADDAVAVIEFGPHPVMLSNLSTATIDAEAALRDVGVAAHEGTALYDAIELSATALKASPLPGHVLVVLTDGRDVSSSSTLDAAVAAARDANVAVYPIGIEGRGFDPGPLRLLAERTGGRYYGAASTSVLARIYSSISQQLAHTWRARYVTAARPGDRIRLGVTVPSTGSATAPLTIPAQPGDVVGSPAPLAFLPAGAYGSAGPVLVGVVAGLLVVGAMLLLLATRRGSWLRGRLAPHTGDVRLARTRRREQRLSALAAVVRATEHAFGRLRHWQAAQTMLDRGETPLRVAELFWIVAGAGFGLGLLAAVAGSSPIVISIAMLVGGLAPIAVVWRRMRKRLGAFETQLPDLLSTIAASLKAGHSFKQGIQAVVDEGQPPASSEFKRVLTEAGLGKPIDDALADMSGRLGSTNFAFAITAVTIQRQVGGSLASLFDTVSETVRQRQQFARKIRSLTAMGRMSAYTLIGLPFLLMAAISLINPAYMQPLFHSSTGHMLLVIGLGMMAIGSAILQKIVSFKG
jgi:tight adherence protein B